MKPKMTILAVAKPLVVACSMLLMALPALGYQGTAFFSAPINWSQTGDLYFTVAGGPPNTCGDLETFRNGELLYGAGWLCTDANGNAVKGPWTWAATPGDQEDRNLRIIWPNGDSTAPIRHIWDKTCSTLVVTSPAGAPPSTFSGLANDGMYGAGFNQSWTYSAGYFLQVETNTYWLPGDTSYSQSPDRFFLVLPDLSGWPSSRDFSDWSINWSFPQIPPASAHVPGYHYKWYVEMTDGDQRCGATTARMFVAQ